MPTVDITAAPIQQITFQRDEDPDAPGGFRLLLHVHYRVETDDPRFAFTRTIQRELTGTQRTTALALLGEIQNEIDTAEGLP